MGEPIQPVKRIAVNQPMTAMMTVDIPARFQECDVVEVRVILTPLRWHDADERYRKGGDETGSLVHIARIEMQDTRYLVHVVRDMVRQLFANYFNLKDIW